MEARGGTPPIRLDEFPRVTRVRGIAAAVDGYNARTVPADVEHGRDQRIACLRRVHQGCMSLMAGCERGMDLEPAVRSWAGCARAELRAAIRTLAADCAVGEPAPGLPSLGTDLLAELANFRVLLSGDLALLLQVTDHAIEVEGSVECLLSMWNSSFAGRVLHAGAVFSNVAACFATLHDLVSGLPRAWASHLGAVAVEALHLSEAAAERLAGEHVTGRDDG